MNCLNGASYVREAIDSVFAQTSNDWEIVFWDNASTDDTAKIAQSYDQRLRYFRSRETVPLGKARESALAEARGEWVTVLDHDDSFLPERFERQMAAVDRGDYVLSYCGYREIDERGKWLRSNVPRNKSGPLFHELLVDFDINIATVMMRRDALRHLRMDTIAEFKMAEDYYLYLSLAARGDVCVVPEVLVTYRQVASSWSERALDRHSLEFHQTLDQIEREIPGISTKFELGFRHARAHADYARAKYLMHVGRPAEARKVLASIRHMRRAYRALYILSFVPPAWNIVHKRSVKARLTNLLMGG
jgi:glycosyltransferase involved in cell wall biosynthesis